METNHASTRCIRPNGRQFALRRDPVSWHLTFEGRTAFFKHELGARYVAYLLLNPPREPLHAVALALKARENSSHPAAPDEAHEQRSMGLEDASAVRALWRRQRELERVLEDRHEIEPVKAEALRELEGVTLFLRTSQWLSRHGAERCVHAVSTAITRFHARLTRSVDPVLQDFALHLYAHLLLPSGRGGRAEHWVSEGRPGALHTRRHGTWCGRVARPAVWSLKSRVLGPQSIVRGLQSTAHAPQPRV
jgi:hypothetical protein